MCVCFDGRFARPEQANGPTGRGRRMKRRDRFAPQNRPERNPAERPGRDVLARRANRDAGCDAAVRPHGRMRDGPKGRSPLRHAQPSRGGRKAYAKVDVLATPLQIPQIAFPRIRSEGGKPTFVACATQMEGLGRSGHSGGFCASNSHLVLPTKGRPEFMFLFQYLGKPARCRK